MGFLLAIGLLLGGTLPLAIDPGPPSAPGAPPPHVPGAPPHRAPGAPPPRAPGNRRAPREPSLRETVTRWMDRLADRHWRTREEATQRLLEVGEAALALLPHPDAIPDAEAACRLAFIRRRLEDDRRQARVTMAAGVTAERIDAQGETTILFTMRHALAQPVTVREIRIEVYGPEGSRLAPAAHRRTASRIGDPRCPRCLEEASRFLRLDRDDPLVRRVTVRNGILTTPAVAYRAGTETGRHWFEYDVSAPGTYRVVATSRYTEGDYRRFVRAHPPGDPAHPCWGLGPDAAMARALRGRFAAGASFTVED